MARAPDKRIEQAKAMYLQGRKLVDIAGELGLPEGTVRRWKCTHKWDSEHSYKKANVRNKKEHIKTDKERAIASDVKQVIENPDLTDKQRLFCLHYVRCFNATKAYQKAYGCDEYTARVNGSRMLTFANIRTEIESLKQNRLNRELLSEHDIFQKYMDIAFADITDYVTFGTREVQYTDKSGEERTVQVPFVDLMDSSGVDGTLVSEVKQGKEGASIKLADRMRALDWLADHMGMATEEQKARIALLQSQIVQKDEAKDQVQDWKQAVIDIAKRRKEKAAEAGRGAGDVEAEECAGGSS